MTDSARLRASDADREKVVDVLREQTGQGRLTLAEFEERAAAAYAAKTYGELEPLTADLPVPHPVLPLPVSAEPATPKPTRREWHVPAVPYALRGWLIVALVLTVISVVGILTGDAHHHGGWGWGFTPWFIFMLIGWSRRGRYYRR